MTDLFTPAGKLDVRRFAAECVNALKEATESARLGGWDNLRTPHVLVGILRKPDATIKLWLEYAALKGDVLADELHRVFKAESPARPDPVPLHREFVSNGVLKLLDTAATKAEKANRAVRQADLVSAILSDPESVVRKALEDSQMDVPALISLLETAVAPPPPGPHLAQPF